jgi:hypothetical protein
VARHSERSLTTCASALLVKLMSAIPDRHLRV